MMHTFTHFLFASLIHMDLIAMLILIIAGVLWCIKRRRWVPHMMSFGICALIVTQISPLGLYMMMHLENQFTAPKTMPQDVEGMILLGGSFDLETTRLRQEPVYNHAGSRVFQAIKLAQHMPHIKIITTGNAIEAKWTEALFKDFGCDASRFVTDATSKRTQDHPYILKDVLDMSKTYLLVTSSFHMPRAVGLFEKAGFRIIPYPVDYHTPRHMSWDFWITSVFKKLTPLALKQACTEWAGLFHYYYVENLSNTLLPNDAFLKDA